MRFWSLAWEIRLFVFVVLVYRKDERERERERAQAQDKGTAHLSLLKLLDAGSEYFIALAEWSRLLFVEGAL